MLDLLGKVGGGQGRRGGGEGDSQPLSPLQAGGRVHGGGGGLVVGVGRPGGLTPAQRGRGGEGGGVGGVLRHVGQLGGGAGLPLVLGELPGAASRVDLLLTGGQRRGCVIVEDVCGGREAGGGLGVVGEVVRVGDGVVSLVLRPHTVHGDTRVC